MSGTPVNSITGDKTVFGRIVGCRRIAQLPGALGSALYAGASAEVGGGFAPGETFAFNSLKRAGTLLLGAETIIGPVYLGAGKTWQGGSALYLFVGQP